MDANPELISALRQIEREKGIDSEVIFEAIEASLVAACKRNYGAAEQNVRAVIDRNDGAVQVFAQKTVVDIDDVYDNLLEIALDEAQKINMSYEVGDICEIAVTPKNFGRIAAQSAKQIVVQKLREAERDKVYNEYKQKEGGIVTGIIQRRERRNIIVELGKTDVALIPAEQIPNETYTQGERIKLFISAVEQTAKGPRITVSRANAGLLRKLFEQEVPEVADGIVEIKAIAREAGSRAKVAVRSENPHVEAVGACVGQSGYRVNVIVNELKGEKIDVIPWSEDERCFIATALGPSSVVAVVLDEESRSAKIVVPDRQLSLAIGAGGQNARLAARLTGWKIDIKGETVARETEFVPIEEFTPERYVQVKITKFERLAAQSRRRYEDDETRALSVFERFAEYSSNNAEKPRKRANFFDIAPDEPETAEQQPQEQFADEYYDDGQEQYYDSEGEYYDDGEYYDEEGEYYDDGEYYDEEYYDDGQEYAEENTEEAAENADGGA